MENWEAAEANFNLIVVSETGHEGPETQCPNGQCFSVRKQHASCERKPRIERTVFSGVGRPRSSSKTGRQLACSAFSLTGMCGVGVSLSVRVDFVRSGA